MSQSLYSFFLLFLAFQMKIHSEIIEICYSLLKSLNNIIKYLYSNFESLIYNKFIIKISYDNYKYKMFKILPFLYLIKLINSK
jgi:hypothetical protein